MSTCYNTTVINAPMDTVWEILSDFHDMTWALGVVDKCQKVGKTAGDQVGAQLVLNDELHQTLQMMNPGAFMMSYSLDDGPDAVSKDNVHGYVSTIRLKPITDGERTFLEWEAHWKNSQGGVGAQMDPFYKDMIQALKRNFP